MKKFIAHRIERVLRGIASACGYHLERKYSPVLRSPVPAGSKLYVGCGDQKLDGYVACDLRALPHVQLACRAWDISRYCQNLSEIYSRHMVEHLTYEEAKLTLRDWHAALAEDGIVRIEVPNIDFAIQQWSRAVWTKESLAQRYSDARWGFAGFFGWQRECDPRQQEYNQTYWDVHKSGYNADSMRFFLEESGFCDITITFEGFTEKQLHRRNLAPNASDNCHLIAVARKNSAANRLAA